MYTTNNEEKQSTRPRWNKNRIFTTDRRRNKKRTVWIIMLNIRDWDHSKDFIGSRLVILPKKLRAEQCSIFRTLCLRSHTTNLLTIIISKRISKKIETNIANDQYGFWKNKGIREAIFWFLHLHKKQIYRPTITYMAFMDLEKAFNSIH